MESPALADLSRRQERLERHAQRWRVAALVLGAALGLAVAVAAAPQAKPQQPQPAQSAEFVKARKFILTDAKGQIRGTFAVGDETDSVSLTLYSPDKTGKATLAVTKTGEPALALDNGGRASMAVISGEGELELTDKKGKPVFRAPGMAKFGMLDGRRGAE